MDPQKYKERILSRFDKTLKCYWDGIPTPPFISLKSDHPQGSIIVRPLGYSPDYSAEVFDICLEPVRNDALSFRPLSYLEPSTLSMSSRIGSHYSPFVGFFSFKKSPVLPDKTKQPIQRIRIPVNRCEDEDFVAIDSYSFAQHIRTDKLVELYKPLVKDYSPISRSSLKNILALATKGLKIEMREFVVSEVCCLTDEYVHWVSEAIFFNLCINPLVRTILSPLNLRMSREHWQYRRIELGEDERKDLKSRVALAKKKIKTTLLWGEKTHKFFALLHKAWDSHYENLTLFDLDSLHGSVDSGIFLKHLNLTMKTVFTRIRIDFFSTVEELFFEHIPNAKGAVLLCESDLEKSQFCRIFTAVDVYLTNQLRNLIMRDLKNLVFFFQRRGADIMRRTRIAASKQTFVSLTMLIGANSRVSLPSFSRLCIGLSDLFEELKKELNSFPRVHKMVFRSLNINTHSMLVISSTELECFRLVIISTLDKTGEFVNTLSSKYVEYFISPSQTALETTKGFPNNIHEVLSLARGHIFKLYCDLADVVYSGCFEIHCREAKEYFVTNWANYLECFYSQVNASLFNYIMQTDAKCLQALEALEHVPQTVEELRALLRHTEEIKCLVKTIKTSQCGDVITWISQMEDNFVPVQSNVYAFAMKLMRWPDILVKLMATSETSVSKIKPELGRNLKLLRANTREQIRTLSTGITELYNMFTFEIRDVALQTCVELQNLVVQIETSVKTIASEEALLGTPSVDSFEDFFTLQRHFDIISQYWSEINKSARLVEYYKCPIGSLKAEQMIEDVRECRRLMHYAILRLRGYPPLVQLGRQQELKLWKFEALEENLCLITIPGLRKHHWKEISRLLATKLKDDAAQVMDMTAPLRKLLDAGIMDHIKEVTGIALQANNDFLTEEAVEDMKSISKKFFFNFTKAAGSHLPRFVVSQECRQTMLLQIEDFFLRSQMFIRKMSLSAPVFNVLTEWKSALSKLQRVFAEWDNAEERWSTLCNYLCVLQNKKGKGLNSAEAFIFEKLTQADDSFRALNETMKRPQFSLYVAIAQDTISDHVSTARLAMDEAMLMLPIVLDKMREVFPRFNFLTDSQLSSFLSTYDTRSLFAILPFMYPRLCRVSIENEFVTAFTTTNGATIPASGQLRLSNDTTEEWMLSFHQILRASTASPIRACYNAFFEMDMKTWLTSWCSQFIVLALRSVHTNGLREAVKNRGILGLKAHKTKMRNITAEVQRVGLSLSERPVQQQVVFSALSYLKFCDSEIDHALSVGITTVTDLDSTPMLQTFITDSDIAIRIMGVVMPYGLEFFGNERVRFFIPQMLEKSVSILLLVTGARSVPILNDTRESRILLQSLCEFCGFFLLTVNCSQTTTFDTMRSYLRGALEAGIVFCVSEYKKLSEEIQDFLTHCFSTIQNIPLRGFSIGCTAELPLGAHGESVRTLIHSKFIGVITTSEPPHKITREFSQVYRPAFIPRVKLVDLIRVYLDAFGITNQSDSAASGFAAMYEHLQEIHPSMFTFTKLYAVVRHASQGVCPNAQCTTDCLFEAFTSIFASALDRDEELRNLLEFYLRHTLGLHLSSFERLLSTSLSNQTNVKTEFAKMMSSCHQVIILGPHFSGKTKLWKDYVGTNKHVVLCTSLMTAHEFYEYNAVEGILKVLAAVAATPLEQHFVVVEEDTFLYATSCISLTLHERVLGPAKTSFTLTPSTSMIVCATTLNHADPGALCDFTVFALPAPSNWRSFLRDRLRDARSSDVAASVMEILLPAVWAAVEHHDCSRAQNDILDTNMNFYATCKQCMALYRRWYNYIQESCYSPTSDAREEDLNSEFNTNLFAARCAVHSVCWAIGLALEPVQLDHVREALFVVEDSLNEIIESYDSVDRILPPLEGGRSILEYVATRGGWKLIGEAVSYIKDLSWSEYVKIDPRCDASLQRFPMPSRLFTLQVIECLINCGQHVLIRGAGGSGKTSLLQSTYACERWIHHFVGCTKGFSPIQTQNQLTSRLFPRSTSTFGPPLGSKLVVCIDDMHLSKSTLNDTYIASSLVLFYEKYSAISTPTAGFIPTTDLVYVGSTLEALRDASAQSPFINVLLPPLEGSELSNGIWRLLEAVCGRRRADSLARECTSFIISAYAAVKHVLMMTSKDTTSTVISENSLSNLGASPCSHLTSFSPIHEMSTQSKTTITPSESILSEHFSVALQGVEIVRQQLATALPDLQVAVNIFIELQRLYIDYYVADENRESLRQSILECAKPTLGKCVSEDKFLAAIEHKKSEGFCDNSKKHMCASKGVEGIGLNMQDIVVQTLSEINPCVTKHTLEDACPDAATESTYNRIQHSICVTLYNSLSAASIQQSLSLPSLPLQDVIQQPVKLNRGMLPSEEPPRHSHVTRQQAGTTSFISAQRLSIILSTVAQSRALFENAFNLAQAVKRMGSPLRILVMSKSTFQLVYLSAILMAVTRFPIVLLRPYCDHSQIGKEEKYDFDAFAKEMRTLVYYAYTNNVRVVVVIPKIILDIPLVMRQIDLLMRLGDLSELFSRQELWALVNEPITSHSKQLPLRRVTNILTVKEEKKLYNYIRRCFTFILQVYDKKYILNSLECECYPCFKDMRILPSLKTKEIISMRQSIVYSVISKGSEYQKSSPEFDCYISGRAELAGLVYSVYEVLEDCVPDTSEERIFTFATLVLHIETVGVKRARDSAFVGSVLANRVDAVTKLLKDDAQLSDEAARRLTSLQERIFELTKELESKNSQYDRCKADLQEAQEIVDRGSSELSKLKAHHDTSLAKVGEMMQEATFALKKIKPPAIQMLGKSLSLKKAILLIRAVYCVLGEEIPQNTANLNELWATGMRRMSAPGFIQSLISVSIDRVTHASTLVSMEKDLRKAAFGKASTCAQLIVDYILAFIAKMRGQEAESMGEKTYLAQKELNAKQKKRLKECVSRVSEVSEEISLIKNTIKGLETNCSEIEARKHMAIEREKRLLIYLNSVDCFTRFAAPPNEIAKQVERANYAQGDGLLMAVYNGFFSMYSPSNLYYSKVQNILRDRGVPFTDSEELPARELLFGTHGNLIDLLISRDLPRRHRCALYTLYYRIVRRWQLFGGVCEVFNAILKEYLLFTCNGCTMVSALDKNVKKILIQAMKDGDGVLLYNLEADPMSIQLILALSVLFESLDVEWGKSCSEDYTKRSTGSNLKKSPMRIPFHVFGQNIEVHPSFNLICVSFALVKPFYAHESICSTIFNYVSLTNFFEPIPLQICIWYGLPRTQGMLKNAHEELLKRRRRMFEEVSAFMKKYDESSKLLSRDLDYIANCGKEELENVDVLLKDTNAHDGQIATLKVQMQIILKQIKEALLPVKTCVEKSIELLRFIEADKLGRRWDDRIVVPFLTFATCITPPGGHRFVTSRLRDQTSERKHFYAVINFVDNIVPSFSCGWPLPARGIFSVIILYGTLFASSSISSYLETQFSTLDTLKPAQYNALLSLIGKRGEANCIDYLLSSQKEKHTADINGPDVAILKKYISQVYLDSGDSMLKRIALSSLDSIEDSPNSTESIASSFVFHFFHFFQNLELARCEVIALRLYTEALEVIKAAYAESFPHRNPRSRLCKPTDAVLLTEQDVFNHSTSSLADCASLNSTFSNSQALLCSNNLPLVNVHSTEKLWEHNTNLYVPLYIVSHNPYATLYVHHHGAVLENWAYEQYEVLGISSETDMIAVRIVNHLLKSHTTDNRKGFWIGLLVDLESRKAKKMIKQFGTANYSKSLSESVHKILATYIGWRLVTMDSNENSSDRVPVRLVLVCTPQIHQLLYKNTHELYPGRCLYVCGEYNSPQRHLLHLLQSQNIIKEMLTQQNDQTLGTCFPSESVEQTVEKSNALLASNILVTTQESDTRNFVSDRRAISNYRKLAEGVQSNDTISPIWKILIKELCFVHISYSERHRLLRYFKQGNTKNPLYHELTELFVNDDAEICRDHMLRLFIQVVQNVLYRDWSWRTSNCEVNEAVGDKDIDDIVFSMPMADLSRGQRAYYYYRNQRRAWQQLQERILTSRAGSVASLGHPNLGGGKPMEHNTRHITLQQPKRRESSQSLEFFKINSIDFTCVQKLVFQLYTVIAQEGGININVSEIELLKLLLRVMVVQPSNYDGSEDREPMVTCGWPCVDSPSPIVLNCSDAYRMTQDVKRCSTDLVELCGDPRAVAMYRARAYKAFLRLLFSTISSQYNSSAEASHGSTDSNTDVVFAERTFSLDLLSRNPLLKKMAPLNLEYENLSNLYNLLCDVKPNVSWLYYRRAAAMILVTIHSLAYVTELELPPGLSSSFCSISNLSGGNIRVWLPPLRHPFVVLFNLSKSLLSFVSVQENKAKSEQSSILVLIVAPRRLLAPWDIVLEGASLSDRVMAEVYAVTDWEVPFSSRQHDRHQEIFLNQESASQRHRTQATGVASIPKEEEIVVAMRSMNVEKDPKSGVNSLHTLNWSTISPAQSISQATKASNMEVPKEDELPSSSSIIWDAKPVVVEGTYREHRPCDFLWDNAANSAALVHDFGLFVEDSSKKNSYTNAGCTDDSEGVFLTENSASISPEIAEPLHSASVTSKGKTVTHYKVAQWQIPIISFQFDFLDGQVTEESPAHHYEDILEAPLCIIYEPHTRSRSAWGKSNAQATEAELKEKAYSNRTTRVGNSQSAFVGALGRYVFIK